MLLAALAAPACVTRTLYIDSDPQGATVYLDGNEAGITPYSEVFEFYGVRRLELRLPGYARQVRQIDLVRPWWQVMPIAVITDLLWPFPLKDSHQFRFELEPIGAQPMGFEQAEAAYERLQELKRREAELEETDP